MAWGQYNEEAGRKAQLVAETTDRSEDKMRRLEEKLTKLQSQQRAAYKCQTCSRPMHGPDQPCPGIKCPECHVCKQCGHLIGAPICPGPSKKTKIGAGKNKVKVKKINSTTKEDTDQEESDVDTIGRINSIRVGAVGSSSTDV